jgi:hypothetical protein
MKSELLIVSTEATNKAQEVLNLTPWGKIQCRLFEDEAISYALDAMKRTKDIKDRFGYFFKIAYKYSLDNRIPLNNKRLIALKEAYKMPEDAKICYEEGEINLKGEKVTYKNKSKVIERAYNPEAERYGEISNRKLAEWEEKKREMNQKRDAYWHQQSIVEKQRSSVPEEALPF